MWNVFSSSVAHRMCDCLHGQKRLKLFPKVLPKGSIRGIEHYAHGAGRGRPSCQNHYEIEISRKIVGIVVNTLYNHRLTIWIAETREQLKTPYTRRSKLYPWCGVHYSTVMTARLNATDKSLISRFKRWDDLSVQFHSKTCSEINSKSGWDVHTIKDITSLVLALIPLCRKWRLEMCISQHSHAMVILKVKI